MSTSAVQRRKRSRLGTLGIVVAVLSILWGGIWFLVQKDLERRFDSWIGQEADRGREWSCAGRKIGGFPFALRISCQSLRMTSDERGLSLGPVHIGWRMYRPWRVDAAIDGPMQFSDENRSIAASWQAARMHLRIKGRTSGNLTVSVNDLDASIQGPEAPQPLSFKAQECEMNTDDIPVTGSGSGIDTALRIVCSNLATSELAAMLRNPAPTNIAVSALLTKTEPFRRNLGRTAMDEWRSGGGQLTLNNLSLTQNANRMTMTGELRLDEERRPSGKIDLTSQGFDILAIAMGKPPKPDATAPDPAKNIKPVTLPTVRLVDGKISIGPLTVPNVRLRPLY